MFYTILMFEGSNLTHTFINKINITYSYDGKFHIALHL
jgi:hypothetical protein